MPVSALESGYLAIVAKAIGMSFPHSVLADSSATVALVERCDVRTRSGVCAVCLTEQALKVPTSLIPP